MRRRLLCLSALILAAASTCFGQTLSVLDFAGGTNGTGVSNANLTTSVHCLAIGESMSSGGGILTYTNAQAQAFVNPKYCSTTAFQGNNTLSVQWPVESVNADKFTLNLGGSQGASFSVGFFIRCGCTTPPTFSIFDNFTIENSSGTEGLTVHFGKQASTDPLRIEIELSGSGSSVNYGNVPVNPDTWYFVSMQYNAGGTHHVAIYPATGGAPLTDLGDSTQTNCTSQVPPLPNVCFMNNIPSRTTTHPGLAIWGFGGSEGAGWGTVFFGSAAWDATGLTFPIMPTSFLSNGIIPQYRAADWSKTGLLDIGGIPSASWTQCGTTIPAGATDATINSALASCGPNQFVLLSAGTYTPISGWVYPANLVGHIALRAAGPNATFVIPTSALPGDLIAIKSSDGTFPPPTTVYNILSGLYQGSQSLQLSSTAGISTNSVLVISQCDTGTSGTGNACPTGAVLDNGGMFNGSTKFVAPNGASRDGPDCGNGWSQTSCSGTTTTGGHFEQEMIPVTAVDSTNNMVTLAYPIKNPNWSAAQSPVAWFFNAMPQVGLEEMSIDMTNAPSRTAVHFQNVYHAWMHDVRLIHQGVLGVKCVACVHFQLDRNYGALSTASIPANVPHFFDTIMGDSSLIQNNIVQGMTTPFHSDGPDSGSAYFANACFNDLTNSDNVGECFRFHSDGSNFIHLEQNYGDLAWPDNTHGTVWSTNAFRNFFFGWDSCANNQCGAQTAKGYHADAFILDPFTRYSSLIANVFGTPGVTSTYSASTLTNFAAVLVGIPSDGGVPPADPLVNASLLRWANWDPITNTVRFCGNSSDTGWTTTCASTSEVPTGAALFPNGVPVLGDTGAGQSALPPSFIYSSAPSWWGSTPWPAIGPDVTSGNISQCSGTINTAGQFNGLPWKVARTGCTLAAAWAGHVNEIPAVACFRNMGGLPDGTNTVLAFDPTTCFGSSGSVPNAPQNLQVVIN